MSNLNDCKAPRHQSPLIAPLEEEDEEEDDDDDDELFQFIR
jgi:hypothetical protein